MLAGACDASIAYETMTVPNLSPPVKPTRKAKVKQQDRTTKTETLDELDYRVRVLQ